MLPRIGYRRAFRYRLQRIARMRGSPHQLAGGVALGTALALTPWVGLHFVFAFLLAKLFRVSLPLALGFTLLNNPWTLPLVMVSGYELGRALLGDSQVGLPPVEAISWNYLLHDGEVLLVPLTMGSTPLALFGFCLIYWPLKRKVARMQAERRAKLDARRAAILAMRPDETTIIPAS